MSKTRHVRIKGAGTKRAIVAITSDDIDKLLEEIAVRVEKRTGFRPNISQCAQKAIRFYAEALRAEDESAA